MGFIIIIIIIRSLCLQMIRGVVCVNFGLIHGLIDSFLVLLDEKLWGSIGPSGLLSKLSDYR